MKKQIFIASVLMSTSLLWGINDGFDFGQGCGAGNGTFSQEIHQFTDYEDAVTVGKIPKDIEGLHIELISDKDIDIRLYAQDGTKLVHWPYGLLNGATKKSVSHNLRQSRRLEI